MNIRIIRLLGGYTLIMILNRNLMFKTAAHQCFIDKSNGTSKAFCTNQILTEVPQDLDAGIEHLDLTGSKLSVLLKGSTFSKYQKLKSITMVNCTIRAADVKYNINDDVTVFQSLDNLELLDMSGLKQNGFPNYKWPPKLKSLKLNSAPIDKKFDASSLVRLEYLDLSNTHLTSFPELNPQAPLKILVMQNVPIMFTVEDLAQYCRITTLIMSFHPDGELGKPKNFCDCFRIYNYKSKIHMDGPNFGCKKDTNTEQKCDVNDASFSESFLRRRKCFGEEVKSTGMFLIFTVIFLVFLVLVTLALAYRYASLRYHVKPITVNDYIDETEETLDEEEEEEETITYSE